MTTLIAALKTDPESEVVTLTLRDEATGSITTRVYEPVCGSAPVKVTQTIREWLRVVRQAGGITRHENGGRQAERKRVA